MRENVQDPSTAIKTERQTKSPNRSVRYSTLAARTDGNIKRYRASARSLPDTRIDAEKSLDFSFVYAQLVSLFCGPFISGSSQ